MGEQNVIILVFLCGLLAMFIELFIPGMVLGMFGMLAVVGSIIYALALGHTTTATVLAVVTIALVPAFFLLWKNVAGKFLALKEQEKDFRPSTKIVEDLVGLEGEALSLLRPSGIARLNDERHDVVTRGEMLEKGTRVKVIEVSGNRIVVRKV